MGSVCCLLPYGPEADRLRLQFAEYHQQFNWSISFDIKPPEEISGGFSLYVCASSQIIEVMQVAGLRAKQIIAYGTPNHLYASFQLGIADYLKVPWDFDELLARTERVLLETVYDLSWARIECNGLTTSINGLNLELPHAIHRLIQIMASNAGQVISRKSLLHLYGLSGRSSRLIDNYVARVRQAIAETTGNRQGILEARYGQGYILAR